MSDIDCLVVGAGVVGLAIGRRFARDGRSVVVSERQSHFGMETSSRNSEVIHAGLYYPADSLKGRLCVAGRKALYAYCEANDVPHRKCGKLVLAADAEEGPILARIAASAALLGTQTILLSGTDATGLEPALTCHSALLSPETGIIDSHALMMQYAADLEQAGGMIACKNEIDAMVWTGNCWRVDIGDETIGARWVVNAAGLHASDLARKVDGIRHSAIPETRFARGLYARATPSPQFGRLIYPVPQPGGLGIHATIDLAGAVRFGPDVEWIEAIDYQADKSRLPAFRTAVARYWPEAAQADFEPDYTGIRPKLSSAGEPAPDFSILEPEALGVPNQIHLFGIESPGLTASLAIADHVGALLPPT